MKTFFVYFSNASPLKVVAETYERKGEYIEFWVTSLVTHLIPAMDVVTIVEEQDEGDRRYD